MKKFLYMAAFVILCCGASLSSCNDDKLGGVSIFKTDAPKKRDALEQWLYLNYTMPYNVDFMYKLVKGQTDFTYNYVPAGSAKTAKLAIITKFIWFDPYTEVAGLDFLKENVPRIIVAVGNPGYTRYRTEVVGSAEGGYKVTLSKVNALTEDLLKDYRSMNGFYFHTMHHEFMHILNQKQPYDKSFEEISRPDYVSGNWTTVPEKRTYQLGFVSPYSMDNPDEDIAELYSIYVTSTPQEWNNIISNAGNNGANTINRKVDFVRKYMKDSWGVDIELLRNAILRRGSRISKLNLNSLK